MNYNSLEKKDLIKELKSRDKEIKDLKGGRERLVEGHKSEIEGLKQRHLAEFNKKDELFKTEFEARERHIQALIAVGQDLVENHNGLLKTLQGTVDNNIQLAGYTKASFENLIPKRK